jgi:hypothetical protein
MSGDIPARQTVTLDASSRRAIRSAVRWGVFWGLFLWFIVFPIVIVIVIVALAAVGISLPFAIEAVNNPPTGGSP